MREGRFTLVAGHRLGDAVQLHHAARLAGNRVEILAGCIAVELSSDGQMGPQSSKHETRDLPSEVSAPVRGSRSTPR